MLVINRRQDEKIVISGEARLTVLKIQTGRVKLGFEGTANIDREEVEPTYGPVCRWCLSEIEIDEFNERVSAAERTKPGIEASYGAVPVRCDCCGAVRAVVVHFDGKRRILV